MPPARSLADKAVNILEQLGEVRVGHEAMMLQDAQKVLKHNREVAQGYQRAMLTDASGQPMITPDPVSASPLAGLADMINLGTVTITTHEPAAAQPATAAAERQFTPAASTPTTPAPTSGKMSKLATAALLAAALATGGVGALAAPAAMKALAWAFKPSEQPKPTNTTPAIDDTDTRYGIRLHPPDKSK